MGSEAKWIPDNKVDLEFIVKIEYGSDFAPKFLKACIPTFKCSNCGNIFFDTMYDRKYDQRYNDGIINYISEAEVTEKAWKEFISRRDLHMYRYCPYCGSSMYNDISKEEGEEEIKNKNSSAATNNNNSFCNLTNVKSLIDLIG